MKAVAQKDFEAAGELQDAYLPMAFKDATTPEIQQFLNTISASDLSKGDKRYLSEAMRKCFPAHSCIDFEQAESSEDRWDQQARELWQTGYTTYEHNLAHIQGEGKCLSSLSFCLFL